METEDLMEKELISCIKEFPRLYNLDTYSEADEVYWERIQKRLGVQKSWLKRRWQKIRTEFKKISIYNHTHNNKLSYKWSDQLCFLTVDLNETDDINFDDVNDSKMQSFHVTQEMLDNCDINESVTIGPVTDNQTDIEYLEYSNLASMAEFEIKNDNCGTEKNIPRGKSLSTQRIGSAVHKNLSNSTNERCEDAIFGELVAVMLKKLSSEDKKRAKKEIMNILL